MDAIETLSNTDITSAIYDINLDNQVVCFQCGNCCRNLKVRVSEFEARRICEGLGLSWHYFLSNFLDPSYDNSASFFIRQRDNACIFLKPTSDKRRTICLIHAWKPLVCREWEADYHRKQCQEGLQKYWGFTFTQEGKLQGNIRVMHEFKEYIKKYCR